MPPQRSRQRATAFTERTAAVPLLVLDTNVALDWVAFNDARASHLLTRDKALLKLAHRLSEPARFAVLAPDVFLRSAQALLLG